MDLGKKKKYIDIKGFFEEPKKKKKKIQNLISGKSESFYIDEKGPSFVNIS